MKLPSEFLVKEIQGKYVFSTAKILHDGSNLKIIDDETRLKIIKELALKPMYPAELAKKLNLHEQRVYYHIKQLVNAGFVDVIESQQIRGTTAKKYAPSSLSFAFSVEHDWKELSLGTIKMNEKLEHFLKPFIELNRFNADIVVGSPDPHGSFKARARDSHYAINLAFFLGGFCKMPDSFSVKLDVDVDLKKANKNLILVGGPVTNLAVSEANDFLPIKFSGSQSWEIISKSKKYTDDSIGLIARITNPFNKDYKILVLAGVRFIGTKAAVIALTKNYNQLLKSFDENKDFAVVVQGFDFDGDGKIDGVEILE